MQVQFLARIYEWVALSSGLFAAMGVCIMIQLFRVNSHLREISKTLESED